MPELREDFRGFLARQHEAYLKRNPRGSLRAFARKLAIDHATLSQLLRGARRVTPATIRKLCPLLEAGDGAAEAFIYLERLRELSGAWRDPDGAARGQGTDALAQRILHAVIEAGGRTNSRDLASRLGTSTDDVNSRLSLLLAQGSLALRGKSWISNPRSA